MYLFTFFSIITTVIATQIPLFSDPQKPIIPSKYWYETIIHNGEATFLDPSIKSSYEVFRNVRNFGADPTGQQDSSTAIQKAINRMLPRWALLIVG